MFTPLIWIIMNWVVALFFFFFSSRRRHTRLVSDWSSDVCSSDLAFVPSIAARHEMLEGKDVTAAASSDALRDEDGAVRADFGEHVAQAITIENSATLRELIGELHQADVGDLIEALDPELRPRLVKLMGHDLDFSALTEVDDTVREEILEELAPKAVAEGVRELGSDDAVAILADLPKEEQTEILEQLPPPERVALARSLLYPENSARRRVPTDFTPVPPPSTLPRPIDY